MTSRVLRSPITHLLLIVTVGALAYANTFRVPFVYDDLESIVQNPVIQDLRNFAPGGPGYAYTPRRWFGYFTFALNYRVGGFHVAGYHLLNLCVHLGVALLVYSFVCLCFRTPHCRNSPLVPWAKAIALLAALLFVAHPVQTQAVTYTVQRLTSLCSFLYLLAIVLYIRARLVQEYPTGLQGPPAQNRAEPAWLLAIVCRHRGAWLIAGATIAALLAMMTKEIAFTLPLAVLVFEASFLRGAWRKRVLALLPLLLTLPLIPLGIWWSGAAPSPTADLAFEHPFRAHTDIPRLDYLLTQFRVLVTYLRLLVLPIGQNVDYDYPRFSSFFTPQVFFSCLLLVSLLLCAVFLLRSSSRRTQGIAPEWRLIAFGIVWFFLTISVESSLVPIGDLISEHRLYLPSLGAAVAVATAVGILARTRSAALRRTVLLLAGLAVVGLATATWQRNRVWASPLLLWQDTVRKSPGKARPWYNLGTYELGIQRLDAAIRALERAVGIDPEHAEAWHNLGLAHLMAGRYEQALVPLRRAVRLEPGLADAEVNLAIALIYTGRTAAAIPHLERVRDQVPTRSDVRYNLGNAYLGIGRLREAEGELTALRKLAPELAATLAGEIRRTYPPQGGSPPPAGAATGE